ncbi:MAG TPA: Gfo/Idh/MocA family oxidoreductase, partial [Candidatus Competibacteraceae bacterium]|nr:Gfo/Idh/MocA family oxidoreductase [Candidatus Competibacteraceae bacterium]
MFERLEGVNRRRFLASMGQGALAAGLFGQTSVQTVRAQPVTPPSAAPASPPKADSAPLSGSPSTLLPPEQRVGFALVGLGKLAIGELLPAFGECKKARLTALVSGSPDKAKTLAAQYGVPESHLYNYQTYDRLADNPDVQVIYIVLPNGMHAEYTIRGAQAGKHILCEKPMATSVQECEAMIAACRQANRQLMVAYRIQYEPHHRWVRERVRNQAYGPVKLIESVNAQRLEDPHQWRLNKALAGGGALPDIGLYCLNTTRFLLGEEPSEVSAMSYSTPNDPRFRDVEEAVLFQMRFPSGALSTNATSYDVHESRRYRVQAPSGWIEIDPAYSYTGLRLKVAQAEGKTEQVTEVEQEAKNQFALEMDHMAECTMNNPRPFTPGEEGLQAQSIMAAIYESARTGKP